MREIPLGRSGKAAIVDDEDYEWLMQWKWQYHYNGYATRGINHPVTGKRTSVRMHRLIAATPEGMQTDHINGDRLDNRRANLRHCTHAENARNRATPRDNTSGYKGVSWHTRDGKWRAQLTTGGRRLHLGSFDRAEDAHAAYVEAVAARHGEFGLTSIARNRPEIR